jgi:hypothetical protein
MHGERSTIYHNLNKLHRPGQQVDDITALHMARHRSSPQGTSTKRRLDSHGHNSACTSNYELDISHSTNTCTASRSCPRQYPACTKADETGHHFLFDGRAHEHVRVALRRALGRKSKSLMNLLRMPESTKVLMEFVARTERLKATFGDV